MVKTAFFRHFAAKQTPTQCVNSIMLSQLHVACTRAFQLIFNLVSAHILARVRLCLFYTILCSFFFGLSFLQRFRFYVGENSRTFQDCRVEFKDLSRIFGNPGLFKTSQTLFKALSTLICFQKHLRPHLSFSYHFHPSTLQCRICFANAFIPSMRMLN